MYKTNFILINQRLRFHTSTCDVSVKTGIFFFSKFQVLVLAGFSRNRYHPFPLHSAVELHPEHDVTVITFSKKYTMSMCNLEKRKVFLILKDFLTK